MLVVHMLSDQSVRLYGAIFINLGHVDIINKVDETLRPGRPVVSSCFFLKRLLQNGCKETGLKNPASSHFWCSLLCNILDVV